MIDDQLSKQKLSIMVFYVSLWCLIYVQMYTMRKEYKNHYQYVMLRWGKRKWRNSKKYTKLLRLCRIKTIKCTIYVSFNWNRTYCLNKISVIFKILIFNTIRANDKFGNNASKQFSNMNSSKFYFVWDILEKNKLGKIKNRWIRISIL